MGKKVSFFFCREPTVGASRQKAKRIAPPVASDRTAACQVDSDGRSRNRATPWKGKWAEKSVKKSGTAENFFVSLPSVLARKKSRKCF